MKALINLPNTFLHIEEVYITVLEYIATTNTTAKILIYHLVFNLYNDLSIN